jgi:predicted site-specific integrase-resolvase
VSNITDRPSPKRAVIYCRVSGEEQRKKGYSLADQLHALRDWCSENGYEISKEVEDGGYSGAYLERPELDRVREMVAAGEVDAVVVLFETASPGASTRSSSPRSSAVTGCGWLPSTVGATTLPTES